MQFLTFAGLALPPIASAPRARRRMRSSSPSAAPPRPTRPTRNSSRRLGPRHDEPEAFGRFADMNALLDENRRDRSMIERKFTRVQQRPEQVLGGLAQLGRLFQLGGPARQFLRN